MTWSEYWKEQHDKFGLDLVEIEMGIEKRRLVMKRTKDYCKAYISDASMEKVLEPLGCYIDELGHCIPYRLEND